MIDRSSLPYVYLTPFFQLPQSSLLEGTAEIMTTLSPPTILPPHADASLVPRPPDGFQWTLIRQEPTALDRRRGYITKFDDKRNDKIEKFEYEKLENMKSRIRLLKLMAGNQD